MLASGLDIISAFSSVAATLNLVGPGLGEVGATDNYEGVSDGGRAILTAVMLIGRLEIFTVLVLLTPRVLATERRLTSQWRVLLAHASFDPAGADGVG